MADTLRWGILSTGNIARQFAAGLAESRRTALAAVGSRSPASAQAFAAAHAVPRSYGSYEEVLTDPTVDAVYNALPNSMHHEWTIKALTAGKHVLCEKPFSVTLAEAEEMFDVARKKGLALIEAFMYRTHPVTHAVTREIRSGTVGHVRLIRTSFAFRTMKVDGNIRFDPKLAGGALMDIGCYCLNFARFYAGAEPTRFFITAHKHDSGVDDYGSGTLEFPNGVLATFSYGMSVQADNTTSICGTDGYIEIPVPWKPPADAATYTVGHSIPPKMDATAGASPPRPRQTNTVSAGQSLYALEADAFAACAQDGAAPFIPPHDTLGNVKLLAQMRREIGLPF